MSNFSNWNAIHILLSVEEVQLIYGGYNKKVKFSDLSTLNDLISEVWNKRPFDFQGSEECRILTILNNSVAIWSSQTPVYSPDVLEKPVSGFRILTSLLDQQKIDNLIIEFRNIRG